MQEDKNILAQPNKIKWSENPPMVNGSDMRMAIQCAAKADNLECDCWKTNCPNFGDCKKCVIYEMCLNQLPTCQRDLLQELSEHQKKHAAK